ncbi:hypothetical protein V8G54_020022 [Vigna mungo]|uniref:Uncharacterized protein n=1 Tax=Vigna mungo TaxID=3915 RepID=A0AAQ3RWB8_VIGMU
MSPSQPLYHHKIRVLHLREIFLHREKKENVARDFALMEDDFANCTTYGSMKKMNLVVKDTIPGSLIWDFSGFRCGFLQVGEDNGPGALHDGDKNCRADDEALNLDDSWLMRKNEDSMEFEIRIS